MTEYWPLAVTLFSATFIIFLSYSIYTGARANKAEDEHKHFGGTPHRSIYDLDTSMTARERLDQRSDASRYKRERTQEVLREERAKLGLHGQEPEGGAYADPKRPPASAHSPITTPSENPTLG